MLRIENPKTGLNKEICISDYSVRDLIKTYNCYMAAGFIVTFLG